MQPTQPQKGAPVNPAEIESLAIEPCVTDNVFSDSIKDGRRMDSTQRQGRRMAKLLSALGMALVLMMIVPGIIHHFENRNAPHGDNKVSLEEYKKIQNGMTYRQLEDVIGGSGATENTSPTGDVITWTGKSPGQWIYVQFDGAKETGEVSLINQFGFE
jgi:hypothetical protein